MRGLLQPVAGAILVAVVVLATRTAQSPQASAGGAGIELTKTPAAPYSPWDVTPR